MLEWAIQRAGYDVQTFTEKKPFVLRWITGEGSPTMKQLETFSKQVYLPFGYFFLPKPPVEKVPIPYFRTIKSNQETISINVYDTILMLQQRQEWLKEYLIDNGYDPLPFVGEFSDNASVDKIVEAIRNTLHLPPDWANQYPNWTKALEALVEHVEDAGICIEFNSVVGNNTTRKIRVDECRGFVLADAYAPFLFINNADSKAAQMFTIVHELAHLWIGQSAGFDLTTMQPADDNTEHLCDQIAAEFLVPKQLFLNVWNDNYAEAARYFKVSEIVIARRAFDLERITRTDFLHFYHDYQTKTKDTKINGGGNFYATARKRLGRTFSTHIKNAVKSEKLLYREAYRLTGLNGSTFNNYIKQL